MGFIGRKWNELVYTLTSNDRYAGYHSSKNIKSLSDNEISMDNNNNVGIDDIEDEERPEDEIHYAIDDREQAQLVADSWEIIRNVLNGVSFEDDVDEVDSFDEVPDSEDIINSLADPCTLKDLKVAQKHLGIKFPYAVIQYFLIHDGQELISSTRRLGIMYGLQLLTLAEVVTETNYWRKVANQENNANYKRSLSIKRKVSIKENREDLSDVFDEENDNILKNDPNFKVIKNLDKIEKRDLKKYPDLVRNMSKHSKKSYLKELPEQKSIPEQKIKLQYANPNWIPLITDNIGNYIAIDLDPDVNGIIGQVIIFGREFDTKYVIANNWGEFMNKFVEDFKDSRKLKLDYDSDMGQFNLVYVGKDGKIIDDGYLYVLSQRVRGVRI